ncbi:MAG: hypothetical protein U9P07_08610 [Pseudomonadota bacterium]|nr:hypothetical protein [Pseudomonadota bacterium]
MIYQRTTIFIIFSLVAMLLFGNAVPGLAAGVFRGSGQPEYQWQHNPFIPLLVAKEAVIMATKGAQAAPYENFSLPPNLKLKAVIKSDNQYKAIVGDQLVVPDDQVMGFIVAEVQADRVVLLKNGRVVELPLRSIVNRKENFTINLTDDKTEINAPDSRQLSSGADSRKSFIHLVNVAGEADLSPAE